MLIAFRVLQGAVWPIIPLSPSALLSSYPPAKSGMAGHVVDNHHGGFSVIVSRFWAGWLSDNVSQWFGTINVPFGLLAAWATWRIYQTATAHPPACPSTKIGLVLLVLLVLGALPRSCWTRARSWIGLAPARLSRWAWWRW